MAQGKLLVRNGASNPLASLEDVRKLGNTGGGDLGDLLVAFASGNHAFMRGSSAKLDKDAPGGCSHLNFLVHKVLTQATAAFSREIQEIPGSGRLSQAEFARLASRAKDGLIKRSDVGSFIAENLLKDPKSKVFGIHTTALLANDLLAFVETIAPAWMKRPFGSGEDTSTAHRELEEKYTKLLGEDNLVGSAGEFGLLFALLANRPDAKELDGEPTVPLRDVEAMFLEKRLPDGWETWKKSRLDWLKNTTGLLISAGKKYWFLKRQL